MYLFILIGKGITGGRGVAGTVLVHKIAGAAAAEGLSLCQVVNVARQVIKDVKSMGFALGMCAIPGSIGSGVSRLPQNSIEVGIGIHGEPGRLIQINEKEPLAPFITKHALDAIIPRLKLLPGSRVAVMINNLGGCADIECSVVAKCVIQALLNQGYPVVRSYVGAFMTSLEMAGISITVLCVDNDDSFLRLLDSATTAPAWRPSGPVILPQDRCPIYPPIAPPIARNVLKEYVSLPQYMLPLIFKICNKLIGHEALVTEYDCVCGDGDCGMIWSKGSRAVLTFVQAAADFKDIGLFFQELADIISESMGGTSGILLEIWVRAVGSWFMQRNDSSKSLDITDWVVAVDCGVQAIMTYGGAQLGMRTLLDAFIPALDVWRNQPSDACFVELWGACTLAANTGVEKTKTMRSAAGRANYIESDVMVGVPDPGAYVVSLIVVSIYEYFTDSFNKI